MSCENSSILAKRLRAVHKLGEAKIGVGSDNAIYEECVCRGTPSIENITNSGLNCDVKLGHFLL